MNSRNNSHAMRFRRIVRISALAYLALFAGGMVLGLLFSLRDTPLAPGEVPFSLWLIALSFILLVVYGATKIYFRSGTIAPSLREGLLFGAVFLGISFIMDVLLVAVHAYYQMDLPLSYYFHPLFLLTSLLVLAMAGAVGWHEAYLLARLRAASPPTPPRPAAKKKKKKKKKRRR